MDAVDRAHVDARRVLEADARFADDVSDDDSSPRRLLHSTTMQITRSRLPVCAQGPGSNAFPRGRSVQPSRSAVGLRSIGPWSADAVVYPMGVSTDLLVAACANGAQVRPECTLQPMGAAPASSDARGMHKSRTIRSRGAAAAVFQYALAVAMILGGAAVLIGQLSPGLGWTLIVLGAGLASARIDGRA
jgi:hypothetical protein